MLHNIGLKLGDFISRSIDLTLTVDINTQMRRSRQDCEELLALTSGQRADGPARSCQVRDALAQEFWERQGRELWEEEQEPDASA